VHKAEIATFLGQQYVTGNKISFGDNIKLRIFVDDEEVLTPSMQIDKEGFSEILFEIPGSRIRTDHPFIKIIGDHTSFAYWFYQ
jgi:hypothetical protein